MAPKVAPGSSKLGFVGMGIMGKAMAKCVPPAPPPPAPRPPGVAHPR